jgi:hypothetical protein
MTFKEGTATEFKKIFVTYKNRIRESRGCIFLELLEDTNDPNLFMTYSVWSSEADLERYRNSEIFKEVWPQAKTLFAKEPEAQTMKRIEKA